MPDTLFPIGIESAAHFSACLTYRYTLTRRWDQGSLVNFLMLNPSAADESSDDPTITRCMRFARRWGHAGIIVTNLYAFRATYPRDLWECPAERRAGPENSEAILESAATSAIVICAWGAHGAKDCRGHAARRLLNSNPLHALGFCANGEPRHPLFLKANAMAFPLGG